MVLSVSKKFKESTRQAEILQVMSTYSDVQSQLSRHRKHQCTPVPDTLNIPEALRTTLRGRELLDDDPNYNEQFLLYSGQGSRLLVFCVCTELEVLRQSKYIVCNGTFEMCPDTAYQLHNESVKEQLLVLKAEPGKSLKKFWHSYDTDACFKNVKILKVDSDVQKFESFRNQFLQALHDNFCQRFPCTNVLPAACVLCKDSLPGDTLKKAFYGENEVVLLCKTFHFESELSADILLDYTM